MKYLVFKKSISKDMEDCVNMENLRVVNAPNVYSEDDQKQYAKDLYVSFFNVGEDEELVVTPIEGYNANILMATDKCKRIYDSAKFITLFDVKNKTSHAGGVIVGTIPAGTVPTDEEILELYFRGNIDAMNKYDKLHIIKSAVPFDRVSIDFGTSNSVFPITENYKIVEE